MNGISTGDPAETDAITLPKMGAAEWRQKSSAKSAPSGARPTKSFEEARPGGVQSQRDDEEHPHDGQQ
jgi:hypothetical protein